MQPVGDQNMGDRRAGDDPARRTARRHGAPGPRSRSRARGAAVLAAGAVLALSVTACSSGSANGGSSSGGALTASAVTVHRSMEIQTGKMDGRSGWPRYSPSSFTAPAGATVVLTIVSYDDGTAPLPPASPWGQVWGGDATYGATTGGTELVDGTPVHSIPNDQVAHTFTIPGLLVNVPIPAAQSSSHPVTVTFTFRVMKKGSFNWLCAAPCGSGETGMGGAMNTDGWMEGHVSFT
ncbi:MAG: hypothetical protein M0007_14480 [Actinomycetota bacterium]|nr:hypothetical protein [Actinomycetota bacterium]